jgi:hypothetical protein
MMMTNTPLNRARKILSGVCSKIEQASQQRRPAGPIEIRRMEFEAVIKMAKEFGIAIATLRID